MPNPAHIDPELFETTKDARVVVEQSRLIHPGWDVDEHLSFLVNDAFLLDSPTDNLAIAAWPVGPQEVPARELIEIWLR